MLPASATIPAGGIEAADIFLSTSLRREVGLTMSVLEALANGLSCIVPDNVHENFAGLRPAPPRDSDAVAEAILRALPETTDARESRLPELLSLGHTAPRYARLFERLKAGTSHSFQ